MIVSNVLPVIMLKEPVWQGLEAAVGRYNIAVSFIYIT